LSNAIKYTKPAGSVTMTLSRGSGFANTVFVSVQDTGIGIPKDEQAQIFQKLHRAKNAQDNVPDGTGLGLYLAKTVVEQAKGGIRDHALQNNGNRCFA